MVEPLRHNRVNGWNHLLGERWWGNRTIGKKSPVQAGYDGFYDYTATCWPEVIEWPWEEDEWGIPFDQDATRGVRTRCIRKADGGEDDWWVAVPKTLGAAYTRNGRCAILTYINNDADYLGINPFLGVPVETGEEGFFQVPVLARS